MSEAEYNAHIAQVLAEMPQREAIQARYREVSKWMRTNFNDPDHRERLVAGMEQTVATFRREERQR